MTVVEEGRREADELEYEFELDGDEFALSWPDGRWLVAHGTGKIQFGKSPRDPAVPIRTMHLDAILALTPIEGVGDQYSASGDLVIDANERNTFRVVPVSRVDGDSLAISVAEAMNAALSTPVAAQGDGS